MSERAKVTSIDALRDFRTALARFVQECSNALAEIDADVQRNASTLRFEKMPSWQKKLRERHEAVIARRADRSRKELTSMADMPSLVEERKNLEKAKRAVEEANEKIEAVKKWSRVIDREAMLYKGQTQSLADALGRDLPAAILRLSRMIDALEKYTKMAAPLTDLAPGSAASERVLAALRGEGDIGAVMAQSSTPALRRRTPPATVRTGLQLETQPAFLEAQGPEMPEGGLLLRLGVGGDTIDPAGRVVLAIGALGGADFYVERVADDGSWYIGPVADNSGALHYEAVPAGMLVELRPGLREVMELPRGYLIKIVAGGVESVINERDEEVFAT